MNTQVTYKRTIMRVGILGWILLFGTQTLPLLAASSVTLAWDPNPETDIAGYRVYYGTSSRAYSITNEAGNITTNVVQGLNAGTTYFFAVTAFNTSGLESDFSNEVNYTVPVSSSSNQPPVISFSGTIAAQKETPTAIAGMQITDPDAGTGTMSLVLSVGKGRVNVSTAVAGGLSAGQIIGNGSGNVTIAAPLNAINTTFSAAAGFLYTGNLNYVGTDDLAVTANDNGNSGLGGPRGASKSIAIQVTGNAIDSWRTLNFTSSDLSNPELEATVWGDNADADQDGKDNLMEFALGLDPNQGNFNDLSVVSGFIESAGAKYATLTFRSRKNQTLLTYLPEVSNDGITWLADAGSVQQINTSNLDSTFELRTYQDLAPVQPGQARFFHLRIVKNSN